MFPHHLILFQLLLLGQAESGKSTLQKQFQLLHSPASLESERASWKIVILFNIARSIRRILESLETWGSLVEERESGRPTSVDIDYASSSSSGSTLRTSQLRVRLSPLVGAETILAERLSGGLKFSGSGKGDVFVRSGWQTRTVGKGKGKARSPGSTPERMDTDDLVFDVAKMLAACKDDIVQLRNHSAVARLIDKKRLRLDEWAELYVLRNLPFDFPYSPPASWITSAGLPIPTISLL
jgi:guanine nucleotide-binding protein subunit alpha